MHFKHKMNAALIYLYLISEGTYEPLMSPLSQTEVANINIFDTSQIKPDAIISYHVGF